MCSFRHICAYLFYSVLSGNENMTFSKKKRREFEGRRSEKMEEEPLSRILFTNADPKYAERLDDKQGVDTVPTMQRVKEVIAFNAELNNETTCQWLRLWPMSEQRGFPLGTGGAEKDVKSGEESNQSSVPKVKSHPIAHHLAPIIKEFILNETQKCCDYELEQTLVLFN